MKPNRLQLALRYLGHRFNRLRPFEVQASVTNQCNLRCKYCACPTLGGEELTTSQWLEVMAQMRRLGCGRFKFQGGEPTTRPDFVELTAAVKRLGMICAVTTNGLNLAQDPGLTAHVDEIVISLDSPHSAGHDRMRGKGVYRQVIKAIDNCQKAGKKTLINMVVHQANLADLEDMLAFCRERGLVFNAQPMITSEVFYASGNDDSVLSLEQIRAVNLKLAQWAADGQPVMFSPQSYRLAASWDAFPENYRIGHGPSECIGGKSYLHIEPSGEVFPCAFLVDRLPAKNLLADGLEQALLAAGDHACADCWIPYMNERRSLAGFKPSAIRALLARNRRQES